MLWVLKKRSSFEHLKHMFELMEKKIMTEQGYEKSLFSNIKCAHPESYSINLFHPNFQHS